jgi:multiple sugar transport system permease protein
MTSNGLYSIGTLLAWVGWIFALRSVVLFVRELLLPKLRTPSTEGPFVPEARFQGGEGKKLLISAVIAGVCLLAVTFLPMNGGVDCPPRTWRLPLVWFVMPWTAWLGFASLAMAIGRGAQAGLALNKDESAARLKAAGAWALAALVFAALYKRDPESSIETLKGGVAFAPITALALLLLAIAAIVAMVLASRSLGTRGYAKAAVVQATLILGSFIFGLPFAFAIITSFKEDRDMSSPNGIVWVPKVQETVPYFDQQNPLYETKYKGETVQGVAIPGAPAGLKRIDIQRPLAIRGNTVDAPVNALKVIPRDIPLVMGTVGGKKFEGKVVKEEDDGSRRVEFTSPADLAGKTQIFAPADVEPIRHTGLRWQNYPDAISFLPPETNNGLVYLRNTLIIVIFSVVGTILSSSIVAYAFSRMKFPGKDFLFTILLSTMMLPGAVTLMPKFLIFRWLGWIDTLYPLWIPAFFASAFNVFLLRQFFQQIPMELEDASKIDGCGYLRAFWQIMLPQIKPALAVIAIWTFMGAWNDFQGPLIYVSSPENMPISYALNLFKGDRSGEPGMLMALTTLSMLPVLLLFFFAQKYFIEGVTLSGLGGR